MSLLYGGGGCYEEGSRHSMAEGDSVNEGLETQLETLLNSYTADELRADTKAFCSDFCKVVEDHASRWRLPLPQLKILEKALCYFTQASTVFSPSCDHVLHTLSSLALSVFELLLFFDQKDFHQEPLKDFTENFQECQLALARHQNVYLLQVEQSVRGGGPWACPAVQAILSGSSLPQSEVDRCISSELPVFFELRIRYLLSCERVSEAMALAKCCAWHPMAGQHLFFLQVYLTWLLKTSQHDSLHNEVAKLNGKDAVHIICSLETEEKDEVLLALSRAFLSQQLSRGDMFYLCDLVFLWSELHHRLQTPKTDLLKEIHQLMLSATNVNSIFPFIRAILQEVGEDGIQFCVELCANALESCLPCDVLTKSLIYKTIAGLLPNDLEVCRACALLVFFLERTVEAYKTVYLLYMHPDQEYHVEYSPIRNHIRFETLQVLKKDLYFDPELWNLIALRTNCLKLMSEKGVGTALDEIMEDKWISNYCTKELSLRSGMVGCQKDLQRTLQGPAKKRHQDEQGNSVSKKLKGVPGRPRLGADQAAKKRGNQGSRTLKDAPSEPLRRSFWQLDRLRDNWGHGEHRRITRLSQKNPPKRRIRTPRWLLEDSGTLAENSIPTKSRKHKLKLQKHRLSGQHKNDVKPSEISDSVAKENHSRQLKKYSLDCGRPPSPPVILELSLPDNELLGSFSEDTYNRQRGFPQMLLYKHTVKPVTPTPAKTVHGKEVILRARDPSMFVQQLHCYARRPKGKGNGLSVQSSVSTITRSSAQVSPVKVPQRRLGAASQAAAQALEPPLLENVLQTKAARAGPRKMATTVEEQPEKSIASQMSSATEEVTRVNVEPPVLDKFLPDASTETLVANQTEEQICGSAAPAGLESMEAPVLEKVQQTQVRERCEESAVEMKVTIASNSLSTRKGAQPPASDKTPKSELAEILVEGGGGSSSSMLELGEEIPPVSTDIVDITAAGSSHAETPLQSNDLHASDVAPPPINQSISKVVVSTKPTKSEGSSLSNSNTPKVMSITGTPSSGSLSDISSLTLVTEVVTEFTQETHTHKLSPSADKLQATSGRSVPEPSDGCSDDGFDPEVNEDGEAVESEESRLEYCCTFCNKVFKGSRVIAHAMFHYRKDECMFCGTVFRDDLLAMMHLSDHIEKLKRSKDTPSSKTSAKSGNASSARRGRGRRKKSDMTSRSESPLEFTAGGTRKLRSDCKPTVGPSSREKKQSASGQRRSRTANRLNGHIDKEKQNADATNSVAREPCRKRSSSVAKSSRLQESRDQGDSSPASPQVHQKSGFAAKAKTETVYVPQDRDSKVVSTEPEEKLCCPVEGCAWFTDTSRNRVRLLYHALDQHPSEVAPLKLAFHIGSSKCSICMRVMWSFDHFLHHVEGHRKSPRYPCLHRGCTARFKTGIEMRRHTRKHSPLQATCCVPGCSQLFICLWALNLHEKEHYVSEAKSKATDQHDPPSRKKQLNHAKPKDKTVTRNDTHKPKGPTFLPPVVDDETLSPPATPAKASASLDHKPTHRRVAKSSSDVKVRRGAPILRLRRRFGKFQVKNRMAAKLPQGVTAGSELIKTQIKVNNSNLPRKRGRPPKFKKVVQTSQPVEATPRPEGAAKATSASSIITKLREKLRKISQKALTQAVSTGCKEASEASADKAEQLAVKSTDQRPSVEEINEAAKIQEFKQAAKEGDGKAEEAAKTNGVQDESNEHIAAPEREGPNAETTQEVAAVTTAPLVMSAESSEESTSERFGTTDGEKERTSLSAPDKNIKKPKNTAKTLGEPVKRGRPPLSLKRVAEARSKVKFAKAELSEGALMTEAATGSDGLPALKQRKKQKKEKMKPQREEEQQQLKKKSLPKSPDAAPRKRKNEGDAQPEAAEEKKYCRLAPIAMEPETSYSEAAPALVVQEEERWISVSGDQSTATAAKAGPSDASVSAPSGPCVPFLSCPINRQTNEDDLKNKICMETLAEYSKKPYQRPPPSVYLDEKYTAMPKRRKEVGLRAGPIFSSPQAGSQDVRRMTTGAPRRQRCANCFTTFCSEEELQRHLQLQRCSNLFGFDSDDEGAVF